MKKISIIVPVYNVEKYLKRCLDSITKQTYSNIEILLVNDGSTDNSGEICNNYSNNDDRIRVIHKKNGGLSDARNIGLEAAKGEYVLFIDSDDYISENACEEFIREIGVNNIDLAMGDMTRIYSNTSGILQFSKDSNKKIITGKEFIKLQMYNNSYNASACRNLYNRRFLLEHKLLFTRGLLHEDEEWLPRVLLNADKVKIIGINFYNYLIRENSITQNKKKEKNALDLLYICELLEEYYSEVNDDLLTKLSDEYILKLYFNAFFTGQLYRRDMKKHLNKKFVYGKAHSFKMHLQVILYGLNKRIYYSVYKHFSK